MAKRKDLLQMHIPEILNEWIKETTPFHNGSPKDSIRLLISHGIIHHMPFFYPNYPQPEKLIVKHYSLIKQCQKGNFDIRERKRHLIDYMDECVKALEFHKRQEKKIFIL